MNRYVAIASCSAILCCAMHADAEILSASPTHFQLRNEATSPLSAEALWERLIDPAAWWHPDHTYSGDAANLSLELAAGGAWREDWDGGSVEHGRVLLVEQGRTLRLQAPFGPLQGVGAYTIWTISVRPSEDGGSVVVFDEVATAPPTADLAAMANAVDYVKREAIARLTAE